MQPFKVVIQAPPQVHLVRLHPSPVDLKEVSGEMFFCNISHRQVLTRTPPLCNSCGHVLGSLRICLIQMKAQTTNTKQVLYKRNKRMKNNSLFVLNRMIYLDQIIHFFTEIAVRFNVYDTIHLLKKESIASQDLKLLLCNSKYLLSRILFV